MIKVIDSANTTLAILENVYNTIISEGLNREFTFDFSSVIDGDKSQYLTYTNKIEVENNYFNMVYLKKNRTPDGITFDIQCEHVSYDLLTANFTAGFTATGLFSSVATTLLSGTGFAVGTVQITASQTISINESTNAMNVLKKLSVLYGGELQFSKYQVNLLTQRGANRGVEFRYRKNLSNATQIIDARQKINGLPRISYDVSVAELEFEQEFIASGANTNEHYELGDTITVFDEDLGLNIPLRIIKDSHNTEFHMQGVVEIANFVQDLSDTVTQIQTTSVAKNNIYNGCSIGPDLGFVATRSDNLARTLMNATQGIKIQRGDGSGSNWTDLFFIDTSGNLTMDGKFTTQTTGGTTLMNIFQDTNGGIIQVYDNSGNLNARLGVESGTASNTGGTFILYNDGITKQRVAMGINKAFDAGLIQVLDTNGNIRAGLNASDAGIDPIIFLTNASSSIVTYLQPTIGYINNEQIATRNWVTANFVHL